MPSRWDGKTGNVPKIGNKRQSKRFSPQIPKDEIDSTSGIHECREAGEYDPDTGSRGFREPGERDLYSPETKGQYKSQWERYQRSLGLQPGAIEQLDQNKTLYKFQSCDAVDGFWKVVARIGATYLYITKREFQILCPKPNTKLGAVDSDGISFVWKQVRGSRTVQFTDETSIDPAIDILSFCREGTGCKDGSVEPIVLNVYPEKQEDLFDSIIIYTTPTSTHYGNSFETAISSPDTNPRRKVVTLKPPAAPYPQYRAQGYLLPTPSNTYTTGWELPSANLEYLIRMIWQENTTGQYLDVQQFRKDTPLLFTGRINTHYRIQSEYNVWGLNSSIDSPRFYFTYSNQVFLTDDTLDGLSFNFTSRSKTLPLGRVGVNYDDVYNGLSFSSKASSNTLPLGRIGQSVSDTYNGLSYQAAGRISKTNLGGMIIR